MSYDEAVVYVQEIVEKLNEHFDASNIMVSWKADSGRDEWLYVNRGAGNFFARKGLAQQFLDDDLNRDAARAIGDAIEPTAPDDGY